MSMKEPMKFKSKEVRKAEKLMAKKLEIYRAMPKIYYVRDRDRYRIGRTDWPGDVFDTISAEEFKTFEWIYTRLQCILVDFTYTNSEEEQTKVVEDAIRRRLGA